MNIDKDIKKFYKLPSIATLLIIFLPLLSSVNTLIVLGSIIYLLWFYFLNRALKMTLNSDRITFKYANLFFNIFVFLNMGYIIISAYYFNFEIPDNHNAVFAFLMAGIVYMCLIISRNLLVSEEGSAENITKLFLTFFNFYILPIGIFVLRRRIIKCLNNTETKGN